MSRIGLRLLPFGILALLLVSMAQSPLRAAPDVGLFIETGNLTARGERPYVDFYEMNPPLIIYLHALPGALARLSGVHPVKVFNAMGFLLIAASTLLSRRELAAARVDRFDLVPDVFASAWAGYSVLLWLPAPWEVNDFAQREHLFVLAWMPYVLLRCRPREGREISRGAAVALGILAGVGCSLKPHFLALAIAAEVAVALTRRSVRSLLAPESVALGAVVVLYAAHFAFLPAAIREAFFGKWLPLAVRYYSVYRKQDASALKPVLAGAAAIGAAAMISAQWLRRQAPTAAVLQAGLGVFTIGGVAIYYVQNKGFFYQQIPALAGLVALASVWLGLGLARVVERLGESRPRLAGVAITAAAALGWLGLAGVAPTVAAGRNYGRDFDAFQRIVETYSDAGEPIAMLSFSTWPEYPTLAQLDRRQGSKFLGLGLLVLGLGARQQGDGDQWVDWMLNQVGEDLRERRPPVVIVWDKSCGSCRGGSLGGELAANASVATALADYRTAPCSELRRAFRLYVRADRTARAVDPALGDFEATVGKFHVAVGQ